MSKDRTVGALGLLGVGALSGQSFRLARHKCLLVMAEFAVPPRALAPHEVIADGPRPGCLQVLHDVEPLLVIETRSCSDIFKNNIIVQIVPGLAGLERQPCTAVPGSKFWPNITGNEGLPFSSASSRASAQVLPHQQT